MIRERDRPKKQKKSFEDFKRKLKQFFTPKTKASKKQKPKAKKASFKDSFNKLKSKIKNAFKPKASKSQKTPKAPKNQNNKKSGKVDITQAVGGVAAVFAVIAVIALLGGVGGTKTVNKNTSSNTVYTGDINGIVREYQVAAGENISAGDFVEFVYNYGYDEFHISPTAPLSACKLSDTKALVVYGDGGNNGCEAAVVLNFDGDSVQIGKKKCFSGSNCAFVKTIALTEKTAVSVVSLGNSPRIAVRLLEVTEENDIVLCSDQTFNTSTYGSDHAVGTNSNEISLTALNSNKIIVGSEIRSGSDSTLDYIFQVNAYSVSDRKSLEVIDYSTFLSGTEEESIGHVSISSLDENRALMAYRTENSDTGYARIITLGDSNLTYGPAYAFSSSSPDNITALSLSKDRVVLLYRNNVSQAEVASVLTVDGTEVVVEETSIISDTILNWTAASLLTENKILLSYDGSAFILTVKGSSLNVGEAVIFNDNGFENTSYGTYKSVLALSPNSALVVYAGAASGKYVGLSIDDNKITVNEISDIGIFVKKATSSYHNIGVAKTSGKEGDIIEVYCVK